MHNAAEGFCDPKTLGIIIHQNIVCHLSTEQLDANSLIPGKYSSYEEWIAMTQDKVMCTLCYISITYISVNL